MNPLRAAAILALAFGFAAYLPAQENSASDLVRVTVQMNADGSKTTYEWDNANHKATATTTLEGKLREKIKYVLDDAGRFQTGQVFGPDHKLRFVTRYKYDNNGKLVEEQQFTKDGQFQHRIVHSYDSAGRETGYAVYDANGKLLGQTGSAQPRSTPKR